MDQESPNYVTQLEELVRVRTEQLAACADENAKLKRAGASRPEAPASFSNKEGRPMLKGICLGAAGMFVLIAGGLLFLFHPMSREFAVGEGAIAAATIWSPIFWGVGIGVVVLGLMSLRSRKTT